MACQPLLFYTEVSFNNHDFQLYTVQKVIFTIILNK